MVVHAKILTGFYHRATSVDTTKMSNFAPVALLSSGIFSKKPLQVKANDLVIAYSLKALSEQETQRGSQAIQKSAPMGVKRDSYDSA